MKRNITNIQNLFLQPDTPVEIWFKIYTKLWRLISKNQEIVDFINNQQISHILKTKNEMINLQYNNTGDTCWVIEDNLIYQYIDTSWVIYYTLPDISEIISDIEDLKNNKDMISSFTGQLDNDKILHLLISTDLKDFPLDIDLSSLGGGNIVLPNACPIDSIVISSINDILNATDLGGNYCFQSNIILDDTIPQIDNFYGNINLNGYQLIDNRTTPLFNNFSGSIQQGIITLNTDNVLINNITQSVINNDKIVTFQNLSFSGNTFSNTCDNQIYLYGCLLSSLKTFSTFNVLNLNIENSIIFTNHFKGVFTYINIDKCEIYPTLILKDDISINIQNLNVNNSKFIYNNNTLTSVGYSFGFLCKISQTHIYNNIMIYSTNNFGTYKDIGLFYNETSSFLSLNNIVIMLSKYSIGGTNDTLSNSPINLSSSTLSTTNNIFLYGDTIVGHYNGSNSYPATVIKNHTSGLPTQSIIFNKTLIKKDNFILVGFDDTIWNLDKIETEGILPFLKNGENYQIKKMLSDLDDPEEIYNDKN